MKERLSSSQSAKKVEQESNPGPQSTRSRTQWAVPGSNQRLARSRDYDVLLGLHGPGDVLLRPIFGFRRTQEALSRGES